MGVPTKIVGNTEGGVVCPFGFMGHDPETSTPRTDADQGRTDHDLQSVDHLLPRLPL